MNDEWEGYPIYEPEEPRDYNATYAWNDNWVFGLPDEGEVSSDSCGAMPFRDVNGTGLKAKKCLRGEDWAWIYTWLWMRYNLPAYTVFGPTGTLPAIVTNRPRLAQLSSAMEYISSIWQNFGQDYQLADQEIALSNVTNVMRSGLINNEQMHQHIPNELSGNWANASNTHVPLRMEYVNNIFADLSALKCTLGEGRFSDGTIINPLYSYSQANKDATPVISAKWLSGIEFWGQEYSHQTKAMSISMQPYLILEVTHSSFNGVARYMTFKVGSEPYYVETTENKKSTFVYPHSEYGESIAYAVTQVMGVDIAPAATDSTRTFCQVNIHSIYIAVWPWYMQLL